MGRVWKGTLCSCTEPNHERPASARASHPSFRRGRQAALAAQVPAEPRPSAHVHLPRGSTRAPLVFGADLFLICGTVPWSLKSQAGKDRFSYWFSPCRVLALGGSDRSREVKLGELVVGNDAPKLREHSLGSQGAMTLEAKLRRKEWRT